MAELRETNLSTVLLGRFNPLIFSPEWLHSNGVIGPKEAEQAREGGIELMAPNFASINLGSMKLTVEEQRFMLLVGDEPLIRAKDFVATCFSVLRHTPVYAVGMNYNVTLVGNDEESWHRLGDALAPKEQWRGFLTDEAGKRLGGLRTIVMEINGGPDPRWAYSRLTFDVPENSRLRALVSVNNHFKLGDQNEPQSGAEAYSVVDELWEEAMTRSRSLVEHVRGIADAV